MQLEDYVSANPHWGNWHLASSECAIYNVRHGYAEFGLVDLATTTVLSDRLVHFLEKSWCRGSEADDLFRAIRALVGLHVTVTIDPYKGIGPKSLPVLRVTLTDAGSAMLGSLYARLRRMLARPIDEIL